MSTIQPEAIQREDASHILITWSDGTRKRYSAAALRKACPCATCREKNEEPASKPKTLPVLSLQEARPLSVEHMRPVGNYAYNVRFSDGHDSGIFPFDLLLELGEPL